MSTKLTTLPDRYYPGFMKNMDGRTIIATELNEAFTEAIDDYGGYEELSHVQRALIERFCFLEFQIRQWEVEIVTEPKKKHMLSRWVQAVNSLQGIAIKLGLTKVEKKAKDLTTYLKDKSKE
ncbi:MAG: hypothetical protein IT426_20185 [Pirellulales bacterium]|nr:hypothetical protein [Pirellulales bacterium]